MGHRAFILIIRRENVYQVLIYEKCSVKCLLPSLCEINFSHCLCTLTFLFIEHLLNSCQGAHRRSRSFFKFVSTFHHLPVLCYSKCGPWTSNSSITWEPVRARGSQASPESSWIRIKSQSNLCTYWTLRSPDLLINIMNEDLFLILLVHHLLLPFLESELRFPRQTKLFPVSGLLACCSLCLDSIFFLSCYCLLFLEDVHLCICPFTHSLCIYWAPKHCA